MKPVNSKLIFIGRILDPFFFFLSRIVNPTPEPHNSQKKNILIFDFHLIGDIVMLMPLLSGIRSNYPNASITLVAGSWAKSILENSNLYDDLIEFNAPWVKKDTLILSIKNCINLTNKLRKNKWDIGIEIRGDFRQIFLLWLSGAFKRVGFSYGGGSPLLTDVVYDDGKLSHILDHHKRINEYLGIDSSNFILGPRFNGKNIDSFKKEYIGFHFGASKVLRRFPEREIIDLLMMHENSQQSLIIFSSFDDNINFDLIKQQLPEKLGKKITVWFGSLREFIHVSQNAIHFYTMDSGPAHIVAALGIPVTVFYGPADFRYVYPIGDNVTILSKPDLACRPCNQIKCTNQVYKYCFKGLAKKSPIIF